ncbi:MAG TPA: non-homologous end-joining DNA ligase [Kofleriaceae bacterium]|jgi:bifunctional non-homologous end joining protein LigD
MGGRHTKVDAAAEQKLATYRAKRSFQTTPEPAGGSARRPVVGPMFVVQKHAASRLHYDFRLEIGGVLVSWAIPKGPTADPAVKRLAARTEDHPIEYGDFEGIIPAGEYGGGTVVVWDTGTWQPEGDAAAALAKGHLRFELSGKKLRGRYHLVKTRGDKGESWLFFKGKDEHARADGSVPWGEESVLTGRTVEEVAGARDRVWHSNRGEKETKARPSAKQKIARKAAAPPAVGAPDLSALIAQLPKALPRGIPLSNLEKVLYPEQGLTKGALVAYYAVVADLMLPHLAGRPLTIVRCPDGRHKHSFYQKHSKVGQPPAIHRVPIEEEGETVEYMAVDDLAGLLGLVQLGSLEIHTWGCRRDRVERPDVLIFDLDPDEALPFSEVTDAAVEVRGQLEGLGLQSFVKTTGGKGLHLVVPIERRTDWDETKEFCHQVAVALTRMRPDRYVAVAGKGKRHGKIFVDYLRNGFGASAIAPYSTRSREGAPVAAPITWDELEAGTVRPGDFTVTELPRRLASLGRDPWRGYFEVKQSIKRPGSPRRAA